MPDSKDRLQRKSIIEYLDRKLRDPRTKELSGPEALIQAREFIRRWRPRAKRKGGLGR